MSKFKNLIRVITICMLAVFCSFSVVSGLLTGFENVYADDDDKSTDDDPSKWIKLSDDTWMYKFKVTDGTKEYYFWEDPYTGYRTDYTPTNPGTIVDRTGTVTNTLNSTQPITLGRLRVGKTVSDDSDSSFVFTITLTDENNEPLTGIVTYSGVMFKDGVGKISLKKDQNRTISIPSGYHYTVTEDPVAGYTSTISSGASSGVIVEDQIAEVNFHNLADPVQLGSFKLKKKVEGNVVNQNTEYRFYVMLSGLKGLATYTINGLDDTFTADENGNATINLALKNNGEAEFINLPVNTKYQVTEQAGAYTASYKLKDAGNVNNFVRSGDEATSENSTLSTAVETLDNGEQVTVEFTNTVSVSTNLVIGKTVINPPASGDSTQFEFTVSLIGLKPNSIYNSDIGRFIADEDGQCEKTFYLSNGETVKIENLPVGASYEVIESANAYKAAYAISGGETASGANDTAERALSTGIKTLNEAESTTVMYSNEVLRSSLSLKKTVVNGSADDLARDYDFTITLRNGVDTPEQKAAPLSGTFHYTKGTNTGDIKFDSTGKATVSLKHNETIVIEGIPVGATYSIEEADYSQYDMTGSCENPEGLITTAGTSVVYNNTVASAAQVTLSKTVRGNLGNRYEDFAMTIQITNSNGTPIPGTYTYSGTIGGQAVTNGSFVVGNDGKARISLRHGDSITFGISAGAVVTVTEDDYSDEGYVVTYVNNGLTVQSSSENEIRVINTNGSIIPTGVLPMAGGGLLVLIGFAILMYINRKRILDIAEKIVFETK